MDNNDGSIHWVALNNMNPLPLPYLSLIVPKLPNDNYRQQTNGTQLWAQFFLSNCLRKASFIKNLYLSTRWIPAPKQLWKLCRYQLLSWKKNDLTGKQWVILSLTSILCLLTSCGMQISMLWIGFCIAPVYQI